MSQRRSNTNSHDHQGGVSFSEPLGRLRGRLPNVFSSIFPIEKVGLKGGKVELLAGPIDQEAEVGPRVILELAIDPLHRFFESLLHHARLRRRRSWLIVLGSLIKKANTGFSLNHEL